MKHHFRIMLDPDLTDTVQPRLVDAGAEEIGIFPPEKQGDPVELLVEADDIVLDVLEETGLELHLDHVEITITITKPEVDSPGEVDTVKP